MFAVLVLLLTAYFCDYHILYYHIIALVCFCTLFVCYSIIRIRCCFLEISFSVILESHYNEYGYGGFSRGENACRSLGSSEKSIRKYYMGLIILTTRSD